MQLLFIVLLILINSIIPSLCVIKVTTIGDSITEGGGCDSETYVDILRELLGDKYSVFNAGKSSQTMLKKGLCNDYTPCSYWNTGIYMIYLFLLNLNC